MPNKYQNKVLEGLGMGVGGGIQSHSPMPTWELYHPFPETIFIPFIAVNVRIGNVDTEPVGVHVGSPATSRIPARDLGS